MAKRLKPKGVKGMDATLKALTVVADNASGEDKVYAHFDNIVHSKDRPFVMSVEQETKRNQTGKIQVNTGWNHVKLDFWTKGNGIFFSQVIE